MKEDHLTDRIEADSIVVEVTDKYTGKTFRRTLPVKYLETDNGLILYGETTEGRPTHISFLSNAAVCRMKDILGKGRDTHRCP
ncbi:MAG: hypothetical protein KGZ75_08230 [Syntrophomonadaceae bacterium]|nr:hypothetical protein [Syntrophomonadaceae bacterium]